MTTYTPQLYCDTSHHKKMSELFDGVADVHLSKNMPKKSSGYAFVQNILSVTGPQHMRILVVLSHCDNYWETAIIRSTIASLTEAYGDQCKITLTVLSTENNLFTLESQIMNHIISRSSYYDVCIAPTAWITNYIKEACRSTKVTLPILFAGVASPVRSGLLRSLKHGSENVIGVRAEAPSYHEHVKALRELKPELCELLIPFDDTLRYYGLPDRQCTMSELFSEAWQDHGGQVKTVYIRPDISIADLLASVASKHSLINLSLDTTVTIQSEEIFDLSRARGIPVFAHNRQAIRRGAAVGTGSHGGEYGPYLAMLIGEICLYRYSVSDLQIPVHYESSEFCFLEPELVRQGFDRLNDAVLRTMRMLPIQYVE